MAQIDTKSLSLLEDQMEHMALAVKKCKLYSQYFTDPALKDLACSMTQHHKEQFNGLLNYLNTH